MGDTSVQIRKPVEPKNRGRSYGILPGYWKEGRMAQAKDVMKFYTVTTD